MGCQAAGSARLREETRDSCLRGRAEHSHSRGERARRGAARRGREGSESWPELLLTQCLEAWQGQAGRSRLPFSVLLGGKHARCRHPLAAHQDTYYPRKAAPPTTLSPKESRCGIRKGVF